MMECILNNATVNVWFSVYIVSLILNHILSRFMTVRNRKFGAWQIISFFIIILNYSNFVLSRFACASITPRSKGHCFSFFMQLKFVSVKNFLKVNHRLSYFIQMILGKCSWNSRCDTVFPKIIFFYNFILLCMNIIWKRYSTIFIYVWHPGLSWANDSCLSSLINRYFQIWFLKSYSDILCIVTQFNINI